MPRKATPTRRSTTDSEPPAKKRGFFPKADFSRLSEDGLETPDEKRLHAVDAALYDARAYAPREGRGLRWMDRTAEELAARYERDTRSRFDHLLREIRAGRVA